MRVYEYAKNLNMSSKEILTILKRLNIDVSNHMSVMDNEMISRVEQFFKDIKASAAARKPSPSQTTEREQAVSQAPNKPAQTAAQGQGQTNQRGQNDRRKQNDRRAQDGQQRRPNGGRVQTNGRNQNSQRPPTSQAKTASPTRPNQQKFNQKEGSTSVGNTNWQVADRVEVVETNDISESKGKTTKKTKPNQKRFDDNKVSSIKGNPRNKGRGGNTRGQTQPNPEVKVKEKVNQTPAKIVVKGSMTVAELAKALRKETSEIIKKLMFLGVMATINQELEMDAIHLIASEYNVEVEEKIEIEADKFEMIEEKDDPADLVERYPVVTIMGHVDHGKTTLLDAIRHTKVTAGEAGGITQHIGAYQVEVNKKKITFLDTPGHAAFTMMRARGAQVTDITILVVAADDGVMPQTVEAISHAKAANVPIIVAINKMDKPGVNPDRIKQELTEFNLVPEEWGGDTIFVPVSALQKEGLEELLEMILLVAEVQELKANPDKRARGTVIEAELDKGRGPVATILVQHGTLRIGDALVAGNAFGRVRAMVNDKGRRIKEAGPSTPVEITGLTEVPMAGDPFIVFEDERKARQVASIRSTKHRQAELNVNTRVTLDDLYKQIKEGEIKDLNVIIKADVQGTVEALRSSLEKIEVEGVRVKIIHTGAGAITESDIILASASNAIIVGFNVRPEPAAQATADSEKVDIRLYRVIYNAIEEIEAAMKGMLDPEYKEAVIGQAEVRQTFKVTRIGTIAGCFVTSGKVTRDAEARVIRDGVVIYEGKIDTLKRFKDDVKEVAQGYECGITLERFNDLKEGDVIEAFVMQTVTR